MAGIESEIAERLGTKRYRAFKDAFQQVAVALSHPEVLGPP